MDPHPGEKYLDLTAGYGGHASKILDVTQQYKGSTLVDRDEFAANYLNQEFSPETGIEIINKDFYSAVLQLLSCGKTYDLGYCNEGSAGFDLDHRFAFLRGRGDNVCLIVCDFSWKDSLVDVKIPVEAFEYLGINKTETLEVSVSVKGFGYSVLPV